MASMTSKLDVLNAYSKIRDRIVRTPVTYSHTLSELCDCKTLFKLENMQMTGAFKERGAFNKLLELTDDEKARGIIAASSGNHAQGVAYGCRQLGIPAKSEQAFPAMFKP